VGVKVLVGVRVTVVVGVLVGVRVRVTVGVDVGNVPVENDHQVPLFVSAMVLGTQVEHMTAWTCQ